MANCKDKFLVQSCCVSADKAAGDVSGLFSAEGGPSVTEAKLRVSYVSPAPPPSPVAEEGEPGNGGGSTPSKSTPPTAFAAHASGAGAPPASPPPSAPWTLGYTLAPSRSAAPAISGLGELDCCLATIGQKGEAPTRLFGCLFGRCSHRKHHRPASERRASSRAPSSSLHSSFVCQTPIGSPANQAGSGDPRRPLQGCCCSARHELAS